MKKNSLEVAFKESRIVLAARKITAFVADSFRKSFIGGFLISDGKEEALYNEGMSRRVLNFRAKRNSPVRKISHFALHEFENSKIVGAIMKMLRNSFALKMRSIGLFIFVYSVFAALALVIQYYPFDRSGWFPQMVVVLSLMIMSVALVLSKKNVIEALCESKLIYGVLSEGLGFDFERKTRETKGVVTKLKFFGVAPILGILCGVMTIFITPIEFVAGVMTLLTAAIVLTKPETGVILAIFTIPFGNIDFLYGMSIVELLIGMTLIGYAFKLFFGRREISFEFLDVFMIFMFIVIFSSCFGASGSGSYEEIRKVALFCVMYFLVVNLIRTRGWYLRAINAFVFSICINIFTGIMIPILSYIPYVSEVIPDMSSLVGTYLFAQPSETIYLLIPAIPYLFAAVVGSKTGRKGTYVVYSILAVMCVTFGGNSVAYLAIVASVAVYVLCVSPSGIFAAAPFGMAYAAVMGFKIPFVSDTLSTLYDLSTKVLEENFNVAKGSLRALADYWITGIGFGSESFSKIYPNYSYVGFEKAENAGITALGIALGFGIFGTLVVACTLIFFVRETLGRVVRTAPGRDRSFLSASAATIVGYITAAFFDNIFAVDTVCLYLFLVMAFSSAYIRITKSEDQRRSVTDPDTPDRVDLILPARVTRKG